MCGIVGILNIDKSKIDLNELERFNNSLKHRGPDNGKTYINSDNTLGLGHRRLSVLDLSDKSNQPFICQDKRFVMVYNGEIYNYIELKNELIDAGFKFLTSGDTEVVINAYKYWGVNCQKKFNGMWSFAIWDDKKKILFISRDRFGVKPSYLYNLDNKKLFFASELKAFMHLNKKHAPSFNFQNLENTIYASNASPTINSKTFLKNVEEILPGHSLTISKNGNIIKQKWWRTIDNLIETPSKHIDKVEKFKDIFFDACKIRMRSDVNVATCLSGGLDSSSIISTLHHLKSSHSISEKILSTNAFILDYKDFNNLDFNYAKEVVNNTSIKSHTVELDVNKITPDEIIKIIYYQEDFTGHNGLGPWHIYKSIKESDIKVTIDGHGADELLGGYDGYTYSFLNEGLSEKNLIKLMNSLKLHLKVHYGQSKSLLLNFLNFLKIKISNKRINQNKNYLYEESKKFKEELDRDNIEKLSVLNRHLYDDFHYKSLQKNLKIFDRFSMAHGVESRNPFLDWRLAAYSFSLPSKNKLNSDYTKVILREAMKKILTDKVLLRTDKAVFHNQKFFFHKKVFDFLKETSCSKDFIESDIFDGKAIQKDIFNKKTNLSEIFKYVQIYYLVKTFNNKVI